MSPAIGACQCRSLPFAAIAVRPSRPPTARCSCEYGQLRSRRSRGLRHLVAAAPQQCLIAGPRAMPLRRARVQTVSALVQPRGTAADNREPATLTANRDPESTPASALDQLGLLVQSRSSGDATLARFKQNIVPQLDAAYNFARFLSRDADA